MTSQAIPCVIAMPDLDIPMDPKASSREHSISL